MRIIEKVSLDYGPRLNEAKSEHIKVNAAGNIEFLNGNCVPAADNAIYLGARLDSKCVVEKEINSRMAACKVICKKVGHAAVLNDF